MSSQFTRRTVLAGLVSTASGAAFARAPDVSPRPLARGDAPVLPARPKKLVGPSEALVQRANLGGEVGFALADVRTGKMIESRLGNTPLPPASTLKAVTAVYALDHLGPEHRFRTRLLATGPVSNGKIDGHLVLVGGGDPTLDTDRLAELAVALREAGITEVKGKFLVWADALPRTDRIDGNQPEHVAYNPAVSGMNLNFNRVHFEWTRLRDDQYKMTLQARSRNYRPDTRVASMSIVDRRAPVYDHWSNGVQDHWTVARRALGKEGARWLPVRYPAEYAGDVFRTLARANGVVLSPPAVIGDLPEGVVIAEVESAPLTPMLQDMLKYSTNLTAEAVGLAASINAGPRPTSLAHSGIRMSAMMSDKYRLGDTRFRDHSGLGYASAVSPEDMVRILCANAHIAPLLKTVNLAVGNKSAPKNVEARAKTGTLNFVSSLAGYIEVGDRMLCFAILTGDTARRDAIPPEQRERPSGARGWSRRSRQLQRELIRNWAASVS